MSYDSVDLDSVSQISAMDSASQTGGSMVNEPTGFANKFQMQSKNFSSDSNIPRSVESNGSHHNVPPGRRNQFPYAYIRSKLSVLPEEQAGQLSRRESMNQNDEEIYRVSQKHHINEIKTEENVEEVTQNDQSNQSARMKKMALRRKRSLSVADIPVPQGFEDLNANQRRRYQYHQHLFKSEESGYDSDTTRKSSPRGSLKNDPNLNGGSNVNRGANGGSHTDLEVSSASSRKEMDTDSMSSGSEDSGAHSTESKNSKDEKENQSKRKLPPPDVKKPPRKSKLPEATFKTTSKSTQMGGECPLQLTQNNNRIFKKNGQENDDNNSALPLNFAENIPSTLPSLSSKRFKMLRLRKDGSGELGIVISKKRHAQKGTTGYIIAHIEDNGLIQRSVSKS